jgi:hypothetical protein
LALQATGHRSRASCNGGGGGASGVSGFSIIEIAQTPRAGDANSAR